MAMFALFLVVHEPSIVGKRDATLQYTMMLVMADDDELSRRFSFGPVRSGLTIDRLRNLGVCLEVWRFMRMNSWMKLSRELRR